MEFPDKEPILHTVGSVEREIWRFKQKEEAKAKASRMNELKVRLFSSRRYFMVLLTSGISGMFWNTLAHPIFPSCSFYTRQLVLLADDFDGF